MHKGSYIVGSRVFGELRTGDIIVFRREGKLLVKRITAVEGDIVIHRGEELRVPEESFYMLGDNRAVSCDSRRWSDIFVSKNSVVAFLRN